MFASLKADCIFVPVDTCSPPASIGRILQKCECRCLLAERSTAGLLDELTRDGWVNEFTRVGLIDGGPNFESGVRAVFTWDDLDSLSCGSCYMGLNVEHLNALRGRDVIRRCDSCNRILYIADMLNQS